jgi:hypothetical protein
MLKQAFKEWAVICRALAEGKQAIILRKGGIAEPGDTFQPEHTRFWLFPTYVHQQEQGIKAEAQPLLQQVQAERPAQGVVRLTHFVEVPGVYHVQDLASALILAHLHMWSEETVRQRFAYRRPGLFVLPVRVYRVPRPLDVPDTVAYAGCRSWVELEKELSTEGATPVLSDAAFQYVLQSLDGLLRPTALA